MKLKRLNIAQLNIAQKILRIASAFLFDFSYQNVSILAKPKYCRGKNVSIRPSPKYPRGSKIFSTFKLYTTTMVTLSFIRPYINATKDRTL